MVLTKLIRDVVCSDYLYTICEWVSFMNGIHRITRWLRRISPLARHRDYRSKRPSPEELKQIGKELYGPTFMVREPVRFEAVQELEAWAPHMKPLAFLQALYSSRLRLGQREKGLIPIYHARIAVLEDPTLSMRDKLLAFSSKRELAAQLLNDGKADELEKLRQDRVKQFREYLRDLQK